MNTEEIISAYLHVPPYVLTMQVYAWTFPDSRELYGGKLGQRKKPRSQENKLRVEKGTEVENTEIGRTSLLYSEKVHRTVAHKFDDTVSNFNYLAF